jgi:hypothetical protein
LSVDSSSGAGIALRSISTVAASGRITMLLALPSRPQDWNTQRSLEMSGMWTQTTLPSEAPASGTVM